MSPRYQVVDLKKAAVGSNTFISYGPSKSGKSWFWSTAPRPLFISQKTEHGWTTTARMNPELFYDPKFAPEIWSVGDHGAMREAIKDAHDRWKRDPASIRTLVIDSLTFYAESYFSQLETEAWAKKGSRPEGKVLYGDLGTHLRYLMNDIHEKFDGGPNIAWLGLDKINDNGRGGLLLAGQTADKAPALCDYWLYHFQNPSGSYEIHSKAFGCYPAGGRMGSRSLPNPLPEPVNFKTLEAALRA